MNTPLIFTQQRWLPRLIDVVLTFIAWAVFVYLFVTGFMGIVQQSTVPGAQRHFGLLLATINTLLMYLLVGAINAAILSIWAKYNEIRRSGGERRKPIPVLEDSQLMSSFNISGEMLDTFRSHQVVAVFHDEHGRISSVAAVSAGPSYTGPVERAEGALMPHVLELAPLAGPIHEAAERSEPSYQP